jgi:hypothetical protein
MESTKGQRHLIAVSGATIVKIREQISGCESCTEDAEIPLSRVMDGVTGRSGSVTDYVLSHPIRCPRCRAEITEETLVEWA